MPNTVRFDQQLPEISKSAALLARAEACIPAGTQTLAKGPTQYSRGVCPSFIERGKGARVWDVDGNEYIDFSMAVGPLSLGYAYPEVDEAIASQLRSGITFSLMHPLEVEVAETIRRVVPRAEMVRFSKTGADVTSAALRLARAFTGKTKVLACGYHGWHDWYIGVTDRHRGIPQEVRDLTFTFSYNDIDSLLEAVDDDVAAVILEPMVMEEPKNNFLHDIRTICTERGIVLIFDEMWTGFRLAIGGAQEHFGVRADLCTFSKAVANGMPLSVLTGREEIMRLLDREVFFFTTFGGEALSLAAAKATISVLEQRNVPEYLRQLGTILQDDLKTILRLRSMEGLSCVGPPCRSMISVSPAIGADPMLVKTFLQQELLRHGILWSGFNTLSYSHTEDDIEYLVRGFGDAFSRLTFALSRQRLREEVMGEVLAPVFRKTGNFNTKPRAII
jgi:glutamate-1-semialdehyde 2,1-aminomutase